MKKKLENSIGKKISIFHEDGIIKTGIINEISTHDKFIGIKLKNVCIEDLDLGSTTFKDNTLSLLYNWEVEDYITFLEE